MSSFKKDDNAVEGIPFKLIILVFILAISLPMIWSGLANYDRTQKENDLRVEIEFIISTIKLVYTGGENNSQLIDVDFTSSFATKVERVLIGDGTRNLWSTVRYKLSNGAMRTIVIQNPNIPVVNRTSGGFEAFEVGEGTHSLLFTAKTHYNLEGDGRNDLYVEVEPVK
jgi:hypothetical protein